LRDAQHARGNERIAFHERDDFGNRDIGLS
jgi:hypothetical protein